jgi:hypothetical protein
MPRTAPNSRRSRTSCSILALATVMAVGATPAAAQSFQGVGNFVNPANGSINQSVAGTTTVTLNSGVEQAVINWTPSDNATNTTNNIVFQPVGTVANFNGPTDFAILNNIDTASLTRAVELNGTINSKVGLTQGGSVYFYAPGGFVLGGQSAFNVGSLVVSALPIVTSGSDFITGFGTTNTVTFGPAATPGASVINNGTINANIPAAGVGGGGDSYVALVAPHVVHNGGISVDGSAALVAAEAATISFSTDGLFNIQVTTGTTSATGIEVNGDIGGPAPDGITDQQGIYLVAVPKNQLMTMVIGNGANLGFTLAGSAAIDANGAVVLSAGHDVTSGLINSAQSGGADTGAEANISVFDSHFTNSVTSKSTGFTHLQGFGALDFDNDLTVSSLGEVWLTTETANGTVDIDGDLFISTDRQGSFGSGDSVTASNILVGTGGGGAITVGTANAGNTIHLSANAMGGGSESAGIHGGDATAGIIEVAAYSGGDITFNGDLTVDAIGVGGSAVGFGVNGGNGTGGFSKNYTIDDGSTMVYNGDVTIDVSGYGANGAFVECFCDGLAGNGTGGTVWYSAQAGVGSAFTVNGATLITGNGLGGFGGSENGGIGIGGNLQVFFGDQATTTLNGNLTMEADGTGGGSESGDGGRGQGGYNYIFRTNAPLTGGALIVNGQVSGSVDGQGGSAQNAGTGGAGTGGLFEIGTDVGSITLNGFVTASADGSGGNSELGTGGAGTGGSGEGGGAGAYAFGGGLIDLTQGASFTAIGTGGTGTLGGTGTGGDTFLYADTGTIQTGGSVSLTSTGTGGEGASGGLGTGGNALVQASGAATGNVTVLGNLNASADGQGGEAFSGNGGNGKGGRVDINAGDGADVVIDGTLFASAEGEGGYAFGAGNGGLGTGGDIDILAQGTGSSVTLDGGGYVDADGYGGSAGIVSTGNGGNGIGGTAGLRADGGTIELGFDLFASADGEGGFSDNAIGGNGDGGKVQLSAFNGGTMHLSGAANLSASASGGDGRVGGNATAYIAPAEDQASAALIIVDGGGSITVDGQTTLNAEASGGDGFNGNGGNASGGQAEVVAGIGTVSLQALDASADAFGGDGGLGGNGGFGTAGNVFVSWTLDTPLAGTISATTVDLSANGQGGAGGVGANGATGGRGGDGGAGTGGVVSPVGSAAGGILDFGDSSFAVNGTGGNGGAGGVGSDGLGGDGGTGGAGTAGRIQMGTISNEGKATTGGSAHYDNVLVATANGAGGDGGNGGSGLSGAGAGGDGGNALGGNASFLARGVLVTAGGVNLAANGTGGDGGSGSLLGDGGNAATGTIQVESKDRFGHTDQRGTLQVGTVTGTAIALGGTGGINGTGTVTDGSFFRVLNGDATIGSFDLLITGETYTTPPSGPSYVLAQDGTATITGTFSFLTDGSLAVYASNGTLTAGTLNLAAANFVTNPGPAPTVRGTFFADSATITTGGDFIADADFDIGSNLIIDAPGKIAAHDFTIDGNLDLLANGGDLTAGKLDVTGDVNLSALGAIDLGTVLAGFFNGDAGGTFDADNITSDADIRISAGDDVTLGNLIAGVPAGESNKAVRIDTDGSVLVGNILSAGGIDITAGGTVTGQNVTTGDVLITEANGAIVYKDISAGLVNPQTPSEPFAVALDSATSIKVDNVVATRSIGFITPGTLTTLDLTTDTDVLVLVNGAISIGDVDADGRILLADSSMFTNAGGTFGDAGDDNIDPETIFAATPIATGGSILIGDVVAGNFQAAAGTSLTVGSLISSGGVALGANGAITTGDLTAGDFVLANGGSITTGAIDADSVDMASTGGNITVNGDINAFGSVALDAFGDILAQDITAGSIDLFAGDDITTLDLTTQQLVLQEFGDQITTLLFPGASITLESGGDISTGDISSIDGVYADAGGSLTTGAIGANDFVQLFAVDDILTDDIFAYDFIEIESLAGGIDTGTLTGGDIDLDAAGNIAFDDVNGYDFDFSAGGNVTGGDIDVFVTAGGEAGGSVTLGNITAGPIVPFDDFSVGIAAIGNIVVENVTGAGHVGFATQGNLTTGNLQSGDLVMTMVGGNTTTGSITTGGEGGGQVYMADDSMFLTGGGTLDGEGDFDPSIVLALDPVPTGGSITINGPVNTGLFRAAAGTSLTGQAITADEIDARAGGTATVNGLWSAPLVTLASGNIDITPTGSIAAGADGVVNLMSSNSQTMLIGDGLTGSGYALSNAEFSRVSGGEINIIAGAFPGAAANTLIGDLTITAGANGNIRNADGGLAIIGLSESGLERDGAMRIVGDVTGTGFANTNYLAFATEHFELDAANGSIALNATGGGLGGELDILADTIHIAELDILLNLAANPTYTGYQQDLNEAATVQRPEGVLRADTIYFESDNLQDILIQNTGTFETPAGFFVRQAFINDDQEVAGPPGSINLIVNGQVQGEGGTLTGIAARDALTVDEDLTPFTANSTINGCPLTGACIIQPPPPPPTANVVDNQIDLINGDPLGDSEFGNEDSIDDGEDGNEDAGNPISPPQPLFDTRPLIPSADVNDPVSGTGNPALIGNAGECDADDENQCATKKEDGQ